MSWDRTGQLVAGVYLGHTVSGLVQESRVKYGGAVQHTVALPAPMNLFGTERTVVLLDDGDLFEVA